MELVVKIKGHRDMGGRPEQWFVQYTVNISVYNGKQFSELRIQSSVTYCIP